MVFSEGLLSRAQGIRELALDRLLTILASALFGALKSVRPLDQLTVASDRPFKQPSRPV
jgi:hypothetical protein